MKLVDFGQSYTDWTVDGYIWEFWFIAQGFVVKHRGHYVDRLPRLAVGDLQVLATETLLEVAKGWPEVCERQNLDPANRKIFWHMLKMRLKWETSTFLGRAQLREGSFTLTGDGGEEIEHPALIRTTLNLHLSPSILQDQIADAVSELNAEQQMILALRFYEEMQRLEIAQILTGNPAPSQSSQGYVFSKMRGAAERVLIRASTFTGMGNVDLPAIPPTSEKYMRAAADWTHDNYGCDVETYLDWVNVNYRADVSLLVDILQAGHGERVRRNATPVHNAALNADQVREIRDELAAGTTGRALANRYGVSEATISLIKNDKSYQRTA